MWRGVRDWEMEKERDPQIESDRNRQCTSFKCMLYLYEGVSFDTTGMYSFN